MKLTVCWLGLIGVGVRTLWAICTSHNEIMWVLVFWVSIAAFSYLHWMEEERRIHKERREALKNGRIY